MRRTSLLRSITSVLCLAFACAASGTDAPAPRTLDVRTSWIGNTFGFGEGTWTQINITAIAIAPDERVFTNAPWDESGAEASVYRDGQMLGYAGGTHGWGGSGGNAVAVNSRYVYVAVGVGNERGRLVKPSIWPPAGKQWTGVSRRDIGDLKRPVPFDGAAPGASGDLNATMKALTTDKDPRAVMARSFLSVNETDDDKRDIGGFAASDALLYVANTAIDLIEVYDAQSMQKKAQFAAPKPGKLALAADGTLWAVIESNGAHYAASGEALKDAPQLSPDSVAVDVAIDKGGRLLVAGGTGKPGPKRFNGPTGVGVDANGNVYVSCNGIGPQLGKLSASLGAMLESYSPEGALR